MMQIRLLSHFAPVVVAAVVAAAVAAGVASYATRKVEQAAHYAGVHAWPNLTDPAKAALVAKLRSLHGARIEILSADGAGTELAQDLDDACEAAGIDSVLDRPMGPIGYGIFVQALEGEANAELLAANLTDAVGVDVKVVRGDTASSGYPLWVVIGKLPRN